MMTFAKIPFLMFVLACVSTLAAAQPATDIVLGELSKRKSNLTFGNLVTFANHKGYDNQPHFHPSQPLIYYSSFDSSGRSDIMVYDYQLRTTTPLTRTHDREYSPTVTPDGKFVSCILQRDNGAQDLVKYPVDGGDPIVLIDNLVVGYHAWVDDHRLLLFVLGEPVTLRLYDLENGQSQILESNIGRSLHRIPGTSKMSFVHKASESEWWIMSWDGTSGKMARICQTLPGHEDIAWTTDGTLLSSDGTNLFSLSPGGKNLWNQVNSDPLNNVTRLAIHPNGKLIAIVVSE